MTRDGKLDAKTIRVMTAILNRILDKGLIVASDSCGICTDKLGRYCLDVALSKRLVRWHNVKPVVTHTASYRRTRKMFSITRLGVRYLARHGGV